MAVKKVAHPSVEERRARGKEARSRTPPSSHTGWAPAADRPDPVGLLEEQNPTREPDLVPVRHGRMLVSPFTFYRGAAKIMAADLAATPTAGLQVQLCGDAHLSNFGLFASPERELLFGLNDFDETLPGPFEYDVKRLAASFTIAGRNNGFGKADTRAVTRASVAAYREAMAGFAQMGRLEVWYAHSDRGGAAAGDAPRRQGRQDQEANEGGQAGREESREGGRQGAHPRQPAGAVEARRAGRRPVPDRQPAADRGPDAGPGGHLWPLRRRDRAGAPDEQFRAYRATLRDDHRRLLEQFEVVDMARKVVGVGSVGTRAFIVLLQGPRPARSAVPAGQGGDQVGPGGPAAQEPLQGAR